MVGQAGQPCKFSKKKSFTLFSEIKPFFRKYKKINANSLCFIDSFVIILLLYPFNASSLCKAYDVTKGNKKVTIETWVQQKRAGNLFFASRILCKFFFHIHY